MLPIALMRVFVAMVALAILTVAAGAAEVTLQDHVSQYGVTWTFDRPYQMGRFINGDFAQLQPFELFCLRAGLTGGVRSSSVLGDELFELFLFKKF